ncbi:uncharacterized protein PHACADRAFT_262965 [Phanerochaete carnosa HHB-10118-sp]|uniref:Uncharacterized protein n=1 Tax=Phanerochaete carnosa (strain HHB-10118-sp) TaxID=650164 RepID=K5VWQ2_PHACS|nr:uncharacterized protein PHACADRAFT_262965 [Phanerochaete carnosa HHB-10118-sp]EKM51024.1 hypothetical protein PHACADRAFT_262965 [Phanerochaete carnosa HHB-10118-sp]
MFEHGESTCTADHAGLTSKYVEPQAISSRWRVLTRRYARNSDTSDILPRLSDQLLEAFKNVVLIAGVRMMAPSLQWTSVQEKMKDIIVESMVVQKAIGEDIAFSDFEVICPESNTQFNADTMEDADDCGCRRRKSVAEGMPVLCTTELGLRRREKVGDQGGRSGIKHTTVMKAKVAL